MIGRLQPDERGMTLAELMVSLMLLAVVSAVFLPAMESALSVTGEITNAARTNDDGRLALGRIDRELRAAEHICDPDPGASGNRLEFRTRAWTSSPPGAGYRDIVYELRDPDGDGALTHLQRSVDGGAWTTVVEGVVNIDLGVALFETEGGAGSSYPSEGRVLTVRLWVDANPNDRLGPRLTTSELTGRNIWTPNSVSC